jgi:hypothetical protein
MSGKNIRKTKKKKYLAELVKLMSLPPGSPSATHQNK